MTLATTFLALLSLSLILSWLAWRQALANHVVLKDARWALDALKTLLIEREHEAGYVSGTSDERRIGAERAADLAAVAVTVAANAVLANHSSDVYDPDGTIVAHIKPVRALEGGDPDAA